MNEKSVTINFSPKTILWVVVGGLALWLAFVLRETFVILFISFIFASAIDPLVDFFEKKKVPRTLAIFGIYLVIIAFIVMLFRVILPPAISQATTFNENKAVYIDKVTSYFRTLSPSLKEAIKNNSISAIEQVGQITASGFLSGAAGIVNGVVAFVVVLVMSFYLLLEKDGTEKWISSYAPKKVQARTISIAKKITKKMSQWFQGQLALAFIIFLADFLALSILHVDYALTLGILAGFLEFLPIIGPLIAGGLAVLVALTVSPILALIVAVYYILIQQVENHILVPQIMKRSVGLHPIAVIVALLAGGKLLGLLGIIIAVPVAAAISVIYNELYRNNTNNGGN